MALGITFRLPYGLRLVAGIIVLTASACSSGGGGGNSGSGNAAPAVSALSPQTVPLAGPGFTLTVTGTHFVPSSIVEWNGSSRSTTYVSSTELTASITAADVAAGGYYQVSVVNPAADGGASSAIAFGVPFPAPSLSLINASSATAGCVDFLMAVAGSNVGTESVVLWNGSPRPTRLIQPGVLQAQINAADIAAVGSAQVSISNPLPGGGTSSTASFTITSSGLPTTAAPAYLVNTAHNGIATTACPVSLPSASAWSANVAGSYSYPLIAGGGVYVQDNSGTVYAYNEASGATLWGPLQLPNDGGSDSNHGMTYDAGVLFLIYNVNGETFPQLQAYDATTGSLRYSAGPLSDDYQGYVGTLVAGNGLVYIVASEVGVEALKETDGSTAWTETNFIPSEAGLIGSTAALTSDGLYLDSICQAQKLNPLTGAGIWGSGYSILSCESAEGFAPVVGGGMVYAHSFIDPTLFYPPFRYDAGNGAEYDANTGSLLGIFLADRLPAISPQVSYILQDDYKDEPLANPDTLCAINLADGRILWTFLGDGKLATSPVVVNGVVFIASSAGTLYALDAATGTELWTAQLPAGANSLEPNGFGYGAAMAAGDGYLVVPTGSTLTAYSISSSH